MTDLLPCPFCGNEDTIFETDEIRKTLVAVRCSNCGCSLGYCGSEDEAAKVWNTRQPMPKGGRMNDDRARFS